MKRKNLIYLVLLLALGGLSWLLLNQRSSGSISGHVKDFSVDDTASLSKIFIAGRDGKSVVLEKKEGYWMVNNKYRARQDIMNVLLETIRRVEVKNPVPNATLPHVMKQMATSSKKVEVYAGDDLKKTFYVGGTTQDELGTYMMLEGADKPFVTHIPGFHGYLSVRFVTDLEAWRDRAVFRYQPGEIELVTVEYPGDKESSFKLRIEDDKYASLVNNEGDTADKINGEFLRDYLDRFRSVHFESILDNKELPPSRKDSIIRQNLFCSISVFDRSGNENKVYFFRRYVSYGEIIVKGPEEDEFRLFLLVNKGRDFVSGQYRIFDPLLVKYQEFFSAPVNKPNL